MEFIDGYFVKECATDEKVVFGVVAVSHSSADLGAADACESDKDGVAVRAACPERNCSSAGGCRKESAVCNRQLHVVTM